MSVATFAAATVSTESSVSFESSQQSRTVSTESRVSFGTTLQPRRWAKYLEVWTTVSTSSASESPRGTPTLIVLPGLRRALSVRIYETSEDVAVEDPETGVFGSGDDLPSAVRDFQEALQDHLAMLAREDALAPALQHQLDILRSYFGDS